MVKMGEKLNNADGQTFEQSLEELETILSELENSKVPLDKLVEKYSTDEAAVIHAALLKKCQAGDMDAIRLWTELQKESGSGAAEVNIVDSI